MPYLLTLFFLLYLLTLSQIIHESKFTLLSKHFIPKYFYIITYLHKKVIHNSSNKQYIFKISPKYLFSLLEINTGSSQGSCIAFVIMSLKSYFLFFITFFSKKCLSTQPYFTLFLWRAISYLYSLLSNIDS